MYAACLSVIYPIQSLGFSTKSAGDTGRYLIPFSSAAIALGLKDYQGAKQLVLATAIVQGATEGLKLATHERRPNGECCSSFPSAHASSAFTGASFIHFRYGFQYSIPFYLASVYVAYSRVQVKAHYTSDVVFGSALAVAGTYLSTTKYIKGNIAIVANEGYAGIIYRKIFD